MIQAIGLTSVSRRQQQPAVDDLTFEARPGRVTVLLGPEGAGKTSALRLMLQLQSGRGIALFRGRPVHLVRHLAREIGVLLGDVPGHPGRTARGHLRMLTAVAGVPAARADDVLDVVGLSGLADQRLGTFSLGMDRRLGIACALLGDPHTLVLDEPGRGLSPREASWLRGLMRGYADQGGAVLVTSRDVGEAARLADRVVSIDAGRLVADQDAEDFARTRLRPRVAVRTPHAERLASVLAQEFRRSDSGGHVRGPVEVVHEGGSRIRVYGSSCSEVGECAYRHSIPVHQLAMESGDTGDAGILVPLTRADGRPPQEAEVPAPQAEVVTVVPSFAAHAPVAAPVVSGTGIGMFFGAETAGEAVGEEGAFTEGQLAAGSDLSSNPLPSESAPPESTLDALFDEAATDGTGEFVAGDLPFDEFTPGTEGEEGLGAEPNSSSRTGSGIQITSDAEPVSGADAPFRTSIPVRPDTTFRTDAPARTDAPLATDATAHVDQETSVEGDCEAQECDDAETTLSLRAVPVPESDADTAPVPASGPAAQERPAERTVERPAELHESDSDSEPEPEPDPESEPASQPALSTEAAHSSTAHSSTTHSATGDSTEGSSAAGKSGAVKPTVGRVRQQPADTLPPRLPAVPRPGPAAPLRYEVHRLFGIRSTWIVVTVAAATALVLALVLGRTGRGLSAVSADAELVPVLRLLTGWPAATSFFLPPAAVAAGLLGAVSFGQEFRYPALTPARSSVPRRLSLLATKMAVSAAVSVLLCLAIALVNAAGLLLCFGADVFALPAAGGSSWPVQAFSVFALTTGCAWAGALAAGISRSALVGTAMVVAVPLLIAPGVRELLSGPAGHSLGGFPERLQAVLLVPWPPAIHHWLSAAFELTAQPVGRALVLSLAALLCAYVVTALRSRAR